MQDYLEIGSSPCDEECAGVGKPEYMEKAREECRRYINQLRAQFGVEPEGARLRIKSNPHDFGEYLEVVCYYNSDLPDSEEYAFKCEGEAWPTWREVPVTNPV